MAGENMPQFGLTLGVKDATLNYEGMPASVDGINIGASVSNPGGSLDKTIIDLSEFRLSMAGNPFKAALYASTPISDLNFKATADGTVHLGKIKDIYPLGDSITLSGIVTADLQFAGRMSDIEKENYQNIRGGGNTNCRRHGFNDERFACRRSEKGAGFGFGQSHVVVSARC